MSGVCFIDGMCLLWVGAWDWFRGELSAESLNLLFITTFIE